MIDITRIDGTTWQLMTELVKRQNRDRVDCLIRALEVTTMKESEKKQGRCLAVRNNGLYFSPMGIFAFTCLGWRIGDLEETSSVNLDPSIFERDFQWLIHGLSVGQSLKHPMCNPFGSLSFSEIAFLLRCLKVYK